MRKMGVTPCFSRTNQRPSKSPTTIGLSEVQFGKSVHMMDLCAYLDEDNRIQYRGSTKPTDSKRYLNPMSFHPEAVFNSIPFSQMLRVVRNNSKEETRKTDLEQCIKSFENSGYKANKLVQWKEKALTKTTNPTTTSSEDDTLVFPVHYFEGISEFKSVLYGLKNEISELIGDTKVMFAMRKNSSIGNVLVRNKQLSQHQNTADGQKCLARGCRQCPLINEERTLTVNGCTVNIPRNLNCKTRNMIYMWLCKLCGEKEVYFGRSIQECHDRTSGHRACFSLDKWEKSALSMHARDVHQTNFTLDIFSVAVVKKVSPQRLRRKEYKFIDKYPTKSLGLNRYKT